MKPLAYFLGRRLRLNAESGEDHHRLFAPGIRIALNAEALPEWIQLAPFGSWPTSERDAEGNPEATQVFNTDAAAKVVKWFNFFPRKLARLARLNTIKVWVGHPDFAPEVWPERIELGDVVELKADDAGLNGRIRWNADAVQHVRKHKFPSVAWDTEPQGDGTEVPVLLWSVGMWHRPNIKSVQAVINAAPDAKEDPDEPEPNDKPMNLLQSIKDLLIKAGLIKESDSDESLLSGIGTLIQNISWRREEEARQEAINKELKTALNAEADVSLEEGVTLVIERMSAAVAAEATLSERINALVAERDSERQARVNALLEHLVETGRMTKAEADAAEDGSARARLNADPAVVEEFMKAKPRLNTGGVQLSSREDVSNAYERSTRLNAWLDEHMATNQCDRGTAWEASKNDPQMKAIHKAMAEADKARAEGGA